MTKNRHIPHATAGKKSHSLRAVVLTAALLVCVTAAVQPAQAQSPSATYEVVDGIAHEPARPDGRADEGKFTITLRNLNDTQAGAGNVAFFFQWISATAGRVLTPGYGTQDDSVASSTLATRQAAGNDFKFVLDYTDVTSTPVMIEFETRGSEPYTNERAALRAPRAMDDVYIFRVIPLYDNNRVGMNVGMNEGIEPLLFGFRVFFSGSGNSTDLTGRVNGGIPDTPVTIGEPLPVALYTRGTANAFEPATDGGMATEGTFTLSLRHLNSDQETADSVAFFFRFATAPTSPPTGQTNGFGTLDPNLSSTKHATISGGDDDFEFILDYRDVDDNPVEITDFRTDSDGNYNNNASPAPRAMDDVYTFRVVPKHDTRDEGMERVAFGYRVFFTDDTNNEHDLHGRVNGTPDTPVVINEPLPTASYAVVDGAAHEPARPGGLADEGKFTITLSHLNEFQTTAPNLAFFFRLARADHVGTPGFGTEDDSLAGAPLATINSQGTDFDFILDYTDVDGEPTTRSFVNDGGIYSTENAGERAPRAMNDVYPVRVVPRYDDDDVENMKDMEGMEFLLFGFRVFFRGDSSNTHKLEGRVNGGTPDTAITINDPGIRLRIRTFLEGALQ